MAIVDEIERIKTNIANTYDALEELGAEIPEEKNSDNLRIVATTIPTGGGEEFISLIDGSMTDFKAPEGTTIIKNQLFNGSTNLKTVELPEGVLEIGVSAFVGCTNASMSKVPTTLKTIGSYSLSGSSSTAEAIKLPETVVLPNIEKIGDYAFRYNKSIKTIDLGENIKTIGNGVKQCTNLEKLIIRKSNLAAAPTLTNGGLDETKIASGSGYIYVPDADISKYTQGTNWSRYASKVKPLSELEG